MSMKGHTHTEEWKKASSERLKGNKYALGKKHTEEWKRGMRGRIPWNKGKKLPQFSGENHPQWKGGWDVRGKKCIDCGQSAKNIARIRCRKCYSKFSVGENSSNWQGGKTDALIKLRHSREYELWRTAVFERDNYTCIWCGLRSGKGIKATLNADHIKPFALFPELRFAIDNGRTLCISCHRNTETYLNRWIKRR